MSWSDREESCKEFAQAFTLSYEVESDFSHLRKGISSVSRWAEVGCSDRNSHKQRQGQCVRVTLKMKVLWEMAVKSFHYD